MKRKSVSQFKLVGERHQVTALFYDIVGSTKVLVNSDPEEYYGLLKEFHKASEGVILRHNGFVHQKLGDGGACYFGYPQQGEDAPEKAVRAALELINNRRRGPLKIRVGVATGMVLISSDRREFVGTAPVLAARLQTKAATNSVLVAESTYRLTQNKFDYEAMNRASFKGFDEPIFIWRPIAPNLSRPAKEEGRLSGRDQELARLMQVWRSARQGDGRSVAIVGDAGIGKSRLVSELHRAVTAGDGDVIRMQCDSRLGSRPLHPVLNCLEAEIEQAGRAPADRPRKARFEISQRGAQILSDFASEKPKDNSTNIRVDDISGQSVRQEVIGAAVEVVCSGAARQATMIILEDMHWADSMTVEFVELLIATGRDLPLLVVQTSRRAVAGAEMLSFQLDLSPLSDVAATQIVDAIWSDGAPAGLAEFVQQKSDGIPLFVEELTLLLKRNSSSVSNAAGWTRLLQEQGVSTLNDLLAARLADVGRARRVAQIASVVGRDFNSAVLGRLMGVDKEAVDRPVESLIMAGLVEKKPDDDGEYRFRHALIHEAAYGTLLRSDSRRIHRQIGRLLVEDETLDAPADLVAWQCAKGGLHYDAARSALQACESRVVKSAMREASQLLDLASEQIALLPQNAQRRELHLDFLELQGVVSAALTGEGSQETRDVFAKAMALIKRKGAADHESRFPLYWGWWFTAPNITVQHLRAEILVKDMEGARDPEVRLQALHCAWAAGFHAAKHEFCLACIAEGLKLYDADRAVRNRALYGGHDAKVCGLGESSLANLLIGDAKASETAIQECLTWATATEHVGSILHSIYYAMELRRSQAEYGEVLQLSERMSRLARDHELPSSQARADIYSGWAIAMTNSLDHGSKRFQAGLDLQQKVGTDENLLIHLDMQSEIQAKSGRHELAVESVDRAIDASRKSGEKFWLAELFRRRAEVRIAQGEEGPARADLRRGIQIAETQRATWLADRSRATLARLEGDR